jgi:hypothetical protein
MQRLLPMIHAQWAYRNATVHLEVKEGWTAAAHETILEKQWKVSCKLILNKHCRLLYCDFAALASGPIGDKL